MSFVYAAGPCQRSLCRVRVPWYSRPYFTVSDLRHPFSSPPTTRRVTVEVFDPASTRESIPLAASGLVLYSRGTDNGENTVLLLRNADHTENTSHVIAKHCWSARVCLPSRCPEADYIIPLFHCWCVHYLETAISVAQPFLHGANMPHYKIKYFRIYQSVSCPSQSLFLSNQTRHSSK
jgi:hypothetical protein